MTIAKRPSRAYATQSIFRDVVVDLKDPVFAIQCQRAPLRQRLVDSLGCIGFQRQRFELCA